MISASDRKLLAASTAKRGWLTITLWCLPVFWIAIALVNLWLAEKLGEPFNLTLWETVILWLNGPGSADVHALTVQALIRVDRAFYEILIAIIFAGLTVIVEMGRRRDNRLAKILKDAGAW